MRNSTVLASVALALVLTGWAGAAQAQYIPRDCGMSYPDYGSITAGSTVILGRHSPYRGDSWWNDDMNRYVGMAARVTVLGGLDPVGCPFVRVDVDGGSWGWRIRDMTLSAPAAPARPPTELCTNLQAMEWLAYNGGTRPGSPVMDAILERQRGACELGLEAGSSETWSNGQALRIGSSWYYSNGQAFQIGSSYYYPNGQAFQIGSSYYYPNGQAMRIGDSYYDASGNLSSESGLISAAIARLPRERADVLMTNYRANSGFWAMVYLTAMVIESR